MRARAGAQFLRELIGPVDHLDDAVELVEDGKAGEGGSGSRH